jgi:hypothetical protein
MHKYLAYRFIACLMAFLLLVSTSGLTMDMHFCEGHIKRINFIGKAQSCQELAQKMKSCCASKNSSKKIKSSCLSKNHDKGCCNNNSIEFNLETDLPITMYSVELDKADCTFFQSNFVDSYKMPADNHNKVLGQIWLKHPLPVSKVYLLFSCFLC